MKVSNLIKECRTLEIDHEPDGYPAIKMKTISALCDAVEQIIPALDLLQTRFEKGAEIEFQNGSYWLFETNGDAICSGKTVREMLMNLIFVDC